VEDMAFGVNHDVSVVTIFELEEIRHDRVRSHACDEVVPGLSSALEFRAIGAIVFAHKIFVKTIYMFSTQHVS